MSEQDGASSIEVMLITGMSGSGKSVALRALEDAGYYCVDNLPPELLVSFVEVERQHKVNRIAIAMDVRSASSLPIVPTEFERFFWMPTPIHWYTVSQKRAVTTPCPRAKRVISDGR
jgi:UPF0042 nucleotide-binding protein